MLFDTFAGTVVVRSEKVSENQLSTADAEYVGGDGSDSDAGTSSSFRKGWKNYRCTMCQSCGLLVHQIVRVGGSHE